MKLFKCEAANKVETAFLQGKWHPTLVEEALLQAQASKKAHDWINYLDICCSIEGITSKNWQYVAQNILDCRLYSHILFLKLINLTLTPNAIRDTSASDHRENQHLLRKLDKPGLTAALSDICRSGYLGTQKSHYPLLLTTGETFWRPDFFAVHHERTAQARAMKLQSHVTSFTQIVYKILESNADNNNRESLPRIAVVGNSPSILGQGLGREIDDADIVVRFNRVSHHSDDQKHIGKKTDLWVISPSTPFKHCPQDAKGVIVSGLHALTRPSFYWRKLPVLNRPIAEMPQSIWHDLVKSFQSPPSAGTLLLASLKSLPVNFDIQCYGFTTNITEFVHLPNHYADTRPRSTRHNWKNEANWLKENFP